MREELLLDFGERLEVNLARRASGPGRPRQVAMALPINEPAAASVRVWKLLSGKALKTAKVVWGQPRPLEGPVRRAPVPIYLASLGSRQGWRLIIFVHWRPHPIMGTLNGLTFSAQSL